MMSIRSYLIFLNVTALLLTVLGSYLYEGVSWWASHMARVPIGAMFPLHLILVFALSLLYLVVTYLLGFQPKCRVMRYDL